jgi:hypothetical protein
MITKIPRAAERSQRSIRRSIIVLEASWGRRRSAEPPVDRDASMEIAHDAIPTLAWTAHTTRRPQRPTGPTRVLRREHKCVR